MHNISRAQFDFSLSRIKTKLHELFSRKNFNTFTTIVMGLALVVVVFAALRQTNLFSHASFLAFNNCTPIPTGLTQQQLLDLQQSKQVVWCNQQNALLTTPTPVPMQNQLAALGDSITTGFYNCTSLASPATCPLQPDNYVYLYAATFLPSGSLYLNFGYAGTTAACSGTCPTNDNPDTSPTAFKNSYIDNAERLPSNESSIQIQANMENRTTPGVVRANLGEFDTLSHTRLVIAWGRNDVDTPAISVDSYRQALTDIVSHVERNGTNVVTLLTISPMDPTGWTTYYLPRHEFDDRIVNLAYPRELDSFFSAQEWEVAYASHALIAPLSEYLWRNLPSDYLSIDHIHPSATGYQLIANVLKEDSGQVTKTDVIQNVGSKYTIHVTVPTYGEIVTSRNGAFYYAEPFYADSKTPYVGMVMSGQTSIYANRLIAVSTSVAINTEVPNFAINNTTVDSVTAYGKGWNWNAVTKQPWVGNGFDLTIVPRFAQGPCQGRAGGTCAFNTRSEFLINGQEVESITAYGKYWNYYLDGTPWPSVAGSSNGNDLTNVPRYASGPCAGRTPGTCAFTSRKQILQQNDKWIEEVAAYNKTWDWDQDGNLISPTPMATPTPVSVTPTQAATPTGYGPTPIATPTGFAPTPTSTQTISLDLNHDGTVNMLDYEYLLNCYGLSDQMSTLSCPHPSWADLNHDGKVDGIDYNMFLRLFPVAYPL